MGRKGLSTAGDTGKMIGRGARRSATRRRLVVGAVGGVPLLIATACNVTGGGTAATGQADGTPPRATALPAPVTIDVGWETSGSVENQFNTGWARETFEQRHPGVTLSVELDGNQQAKVLARAAAGTPPHVIVLGVTLPAFYVSQNLLLPLDGFIAKDRGNSKAEFAPNIWDAFAVQGKQVALPRAGGPTVLYYNKTLLEAGGVTAPTENWTLAEQFREAAVRLTRPGEANGRQPVFGVDIGWNWRNWVLSNGGEILDAAATRYTLDRDPAVEGLQSYQDLRYRYRCATTPQDMQQQGALARFMAGGLAFLPHLRWVAGTEGFIQPHVGIAQHPRGKAGRKFTMPSNGLALLQPNKHPELSWEAAKWFVSAELQKKHYSLGPGGVVARLSVLQSEEYLTSQIPRQWNEFFAKGVAGLLAPPKHPKWPEIDSTINRELGAFENGQETAAAATARIAPIVQSLLR
ncbi:MAG: sugar ABC transporter substrate-binding protein [Chloroflexi bacterium]|nr:sugar ABC transporter substrate-binding protein [Chloroflexota bacterium]